MKSNTHEIGKRIKKLRKEEQLTQTEFGERIGVKGNTVTGYENGTRRPSDSILNYICLVFGVDQTWLRTGEGDMYIPVTDYRSALEQLLYEKKCNNMEATFLDAYFRLNKGERKAFCELIVKMFPDAISKIVGNNPTEPYSILWEEAPASTESSMNSVADILSSETEIEALAQKAAEITREQGISEKKQESSASSAKESDAG